MKKFLTLFLITGILSLSSCSLITINNNGSDSSSGSSLAVENSTPQQETIPQQNNSSQQDNSLQQDNTSQQETTPQQNNSSQQDNISQQETAPQQNSNSNNQTIDLTNIREIDIEIETGNCNVTIDDSANAVVNAEIADSSENIALKCDVRRDTLYIEFVDSATGREIDDTRLRNIATDLDISMPATVSYLDVSVDRGNIALNTNGTNYEENYSDYDEGEQEKMITINNTCKAELSADSGDITIS